MYGIESDDFHLRVEPIMRKVFHCIDDWNCQLFMPQITSKRVVYPINFPCGSLDEDNTSKALLNAVVNASSSLNERGCYLSPLGCRGPGFGSKHKRFDDVYIPLTELFEGFTKFGESKLIIEQVAIDLSNHFLLYSESGVWGLFAWYDDFGILGGSSDFMGTLEISIPDIDTQCYRFLRDLKAEAMAFSSGLARTLPGVRAMLEHTYGHSKADILLQETGWR